MVVLSTDAIMIVLPCDALMVFFRTSQGATLGAPISRFPWPAALYRPVRRGDPSKESARGLRPWSDGQGGGNTPSPCGKEFCDVLFCLPRPAQHEGIEPARDLDQAASGRRMERRQRMADHVRRDDAAFPHQDLAGGQSALPVLVIDQRQPSVVAGDRRIALAGCEIVDDGAH